MANKPDQGPIFKLPQGTAQTEWVNGGTVVDGYGKNPTKDRYNPDRGEEVPRDPQRRLKDR
jgi:hypothetical protein